jgi:hypothetical protein
MNKCFFLFLACLVTLFISCNRNKPLFVQVSAERSGIDFANTIIEHDSINPIDLTNIYNGGGIGIGDFNKDGLPDIYFTGNQVSNKLYINKGNFKFEDVTAIAGVDGEGKWSRGVSVVDINNDGLPDIYVCTTLKKTAKERTNLLYINQGPDKNGVPHFKEMAAEYGLADTAHCTMASFFDYDNDGDLDVYIAVNEIVKGDIPSRYRPKIKDGSYPSTGRLYRNDWNDSLKHPVFTNVTKEAGVTIEGYGHAVSIADFNKDGWKDIYVTNDFNSNDLLYINNHDGTFTDKASTYFKHTSANGMGQDVVDMNNDGLPDVVELDMNPEDNYRKKMMLGSVSYLNYQNSEYFGYQFQYVRNSLQLNQGPRVNQNDSIGDPIFSDIGFLAGMSQTDWSWTPVVTDFDNDGNRDLVITNGYPKDITDHDFVAYRSKAANFLPNSELLKLIPQVKIHNYAFKNNGDLTFSDVSLDWGLGTPTFSNGAVYADLDNDGAMDLIVNNINDKALVYRNTSRDNEKERNHYLNIEFVGGQYNRNGLGAIVELHYGQGKQQVYENSPYRGYLSTVQDIAHFGLGNLQTVDSVVVIWPNNKMQLLRNVKTDQTLKVKIMDADLPHSFESPAIASNALFKEITDSLGIHYTHQQRDYIDFNIQKLLPHKFSEYGPSIAVGDIDGNGLDDMVLGGAANKSAEIFLQQANGKFIQKDLGPLAADTLNKKTDDLGVLLFDADGDGDLDLFIARGGFASKENTSDYQDQLYINDGKGNFTLASNALPQNFASKLCVRAIDYDHDGDLDLFISGRVDPGNYPKPVSCFIYRNDSKNGQVKFTDVTSTVAKDLNNIGMVCDAIWTDFDNDGWEDLVLAGEWMPVTFLKNDKGVFKNVSNGTGIDNQKGWWNSIVAGDFDNDGDIDYVVTNLGRNSFYQASEKYPVHVYGKDFDKNGFYDMVPTLYLPSVVDGEKKEFTTQGYDDMVRQLPSLRKKFLTYKSFAEADINEIFTDEERKGALILEANNFNTCMLRNDGNGKFTMVPLPTQAQFSMINGMIADDFDGDGNLDILMNGNDYGTEVQVGRYDAFNGLFLHGDGRGNFTPQTILQSGIFIPGNGKALVKLGGVNGKCLVAASQNRGPLKVYQLEKSHQKVPLEFLDEKAFIKYKNGKTAVQECYYGSSFLSQSGRFLLLNNDVASVKITNSLGKSRVINF